ncbi:uncharacterized protein LOC141659737 [Apium graveolens]|uniref:uncharacterized protein LOC141659737 n=1 Tax=Apium graveolens TaxID=4045 RepID=UPI003D7B6F72
MLYPGYYKDWLKRTGNTDGTGNSRGGRGFKGTSRDKNTVRCFNCIMLGHYAADCKRPRRERNQKSKANLVEIKDDEPALLLSELDESKTTMVLRNEEKVIPRFEKDPTTKRTSQVWYLDNGASNYMTRDKTKFSMLDERITGEVKFGDGSTVNIKGKGSITFKYKNEEERIFDNVFYISCHCNNIISLGQMSEEGNKVVMLRELLWVYEKDGRALMKVKGSVNRLYKIMLEESPGACLHTQNTKMEEDLWLWQCRLGHANFNVMSILK